MIREGTPNSSHIEHKGIAVSLEERRRVLGELAAAYANSASREVGLQKANTLPGERRGLKRGMVDERTGLSRAPLGAHVSDV